MLGAKLEDLKLKDKKLQKLPRLGNARASTVAALGLRSFPEGDPVKDNEMRSL